MFDTRISTGVHVFQLGVCTNIHFHRQVRQNGTVISFLNENISSKRTESLDTASWFSKRWIALTASSPPLVLIAEFFKEVEGEKW